MTPWIRNLVVRDAEVVPGINGVQVAACDRLLLGFWKCMTAYFVGSNLTLFSLAHSIALICRSSNVRRFF